MAASDNGIQEREFVELGKILPVLRNDELLTHAEALEIASTKNVEERRLEFHTLLIQKKPQTALLILNMLRRLNRRIWTEENFKKHPLQNPMIANNIMQFLPFDDILNCRLVCKDWKTGADEFLKQETVIQIYSTDLVSDFCNVLKETGDLLIPYNRLCFWGKEDGLTICTTEITKAFESYGERVKYLQFLKVNLESQGNYLANYDMSGWISKLNNLVELEIDSCKDHDLQLSKSTLLKVDWNKLKSIKSIKFNFVVITLKKDGNILIVPFAISWCKVIFMKDGVEMKEVRLNDIIDFSQASEIHVCGCEDKTNDKTILDMQSQEFNCAKLRLISLELENWGKAKGNVKYFLLFGSDFVEKNQLKIMQLCSAFSKIDLAALPCTIQNLHFGELLEYTCTEEIEFPDLQFLQFGNSDDTNQIIHFANCYNLVELELGSIHKPKEFTALNVRSIPKNVRRIKINRTRIVDFEDEENDKDYTYELETLILEDHLNRLRTDVARMILKIRPKILVVSCWGLGEEFDNTNIIKFVKENQQLEKIIIGTLNNLDLHTNNPFECSIFSDYVEGIKSNCYQFEKKYGKPLTNSEFQQWMKLNGSFCEHCNHF